MPLIKAFVLASLMWELGWIASLTMNFKRERIVPLTKKERFIIIPLGVIGILAQTLSIAVVVTLIAIGV